VKDVENALRENYEQRLQSYPMKGSCNRMNSIRSHPRKGSCNCGSGASNWFYVRLARTLTLLVAVRAKFERMNHRHQTRWRLSIRRLRTYEYATS